jgi:hypothetical protein
VVLFELTLLERIGRIRIAYESMRQQLALRPGFELADLTAEDVDGARTLHVLVGLAAGRTLGFSPTRVQPSRRGDQC